MTTGTGRPQPSRLPQRRCALCARQDFEPLHWFNQMLDLFDPATAVYTCLSCRLTQRFELPTEEDCPAQMQDGDYSAGTEVLLPRLAERLAASCAPPCQGPVLDIGAGTGSFVRTAREFGFHAVGVELPNNDAPPEGVVHLHICKTPIPGLAPGSCALVHIHHVLEHVTDLLCFLRAAQSYLQPKITFIIEVPNEIKSWAIRFKRLLGLKYTSRTAYLSHRTFFTRQTLTKVLHATGLNILRLRTPVTCSHISLPHRALDRAQTFFGAGHTLEVYCSLSSKTGGESRSGMAHANDAPTHS